MKTPWQRMEDEEGGESLVKPESPGRNRRIRGGDVTASWVLIALPVWVGGSWCVASYLERLIP